MAATNNLRVGSEGIRAENVEKGVKGFADRLFKFKPLLLQQSSSAWTEKYLEEDSTVLTGMTGSAITGVPRLAGFPNVQPNWTERSGVHTKYAGQNSISMEDILTDAIGVQARTMFKISQSIVSAVDTAIYAAIIAATNLNTFAITGGNEWDSATVANRDPIDNLLNAIQLIDEDDYDVLENGFVLLSPKDHRNLIGNSKVINNPSFKTADVVSNGRVGQVTGLTIVKSVNVPADEALVLFGQRTATWKSVQQLTSTVIDDPGIKITIRAWEIGLIQVTDPKSACRITNTQA